MEKADIVIIGAGIVGLSIAKELSDCRRSVYILEKHNSFGQEISSRNSEVIHAGIYYPKGSLKAKLCVEGNERLYEICLKNNIPHKRIGKLIVAADKNEEKELQKLFEKGCCNGVKALRLISREALKDLEPNVQGECALYSPNTGIVDTHSLMKYFEHSVKDNNGEVVYDCEVIGLKKSGKGYVVTTKSTNEEVFEFQAQAIINSAGLNSDTVAQMAGIDLKKHDYSLKYCKGQYFRIANTKKCNLINRLIYPVPQEKSAGLGVHITKDLSGGLRLGPDTRYINRNNFNYEVDISEKGNFLNSASKFLPFLENEDLIPDTSGVRPKLQGEGEDFHDFVIKEESDSGFPGLINLIGIESPGLTACVAIAKYVAAITKKVF